MLAFLFFCFPFSGHAIGPKPEYYQITVYHFTTASQETRLDDYLKAALLPALHKKGIPTIGVFKPLANDTATDKIIYVLVPMKSFEELLGLPAALEKDAAYKSAATAYTDAAYNNAPYTRMESIWLQAFPLAPKLQLPVLKGPHEDHIYELRSYESATEKLHRNKVTMFNEGGEVPLFKRLNFNGIFYADVINGSRMPNLMYLTSFDDRASREAHWKAFGADAEWKKLSAMPEYQHNVAKAEVILCHATAYSDL